MDQKRSVSEAENMKGTRQKTKREEGRKHEGKKAESRVFGAAIGAGLWIGNVQVSMGLRPGCVAWGSVSESGGL
eukprot:361810-Chlamydomonas_euryale.AAC.5